MSDAVPPRKHLGGIQYREFVAQVSRLKKARNYLEIGVHNGSTISLIDCPTIGVDPNFVFNRNPMGAKPVMHLYQLTSDDFFESHDPRRIFGSDVDMAFLDGLHLFEYLLRDFMNTEKVSAPDALILLDDCMPRNLEMAEREHRRELRKDKAIAGWWTGDVWKVVSILREYRPDLEITPVDVTPTGSIVVSKLDPASTRLQDSYDEILARYMDREMDEAIFEDYWRVNAPITVEAAIQKLSGYWRADD